MSAIPPDRVWIERDSLVDAPSIDAHSIEILSRSHTDVTAHDRNLDEKVRSLITALAFLTVAGVTLFIYSNPHEVPKDLTLDGRNWNAANVFFSFFVTSLILSLMAALVALDPRSFRPDFLAPKSDRSVLYSTDIAKGARSWQAHVDAPAAEKRSNVFRSYGTDTVELARRIRHKERRLGDAQGFIFMAMVNLGLVGVVRLPASAPATRATLIISALMALPFFLAPTTLIFMGRDGYLTWDEMKADVIALLLLYGMPAAIVITLGVWALAFGGSYWMAILAGLAAVLTTSHPSVILFFSLLRKYSAKGFSKGLLRCMLKMPGWILRGLVFSWKSVRKAPRAAAEPRPHVLKDETEPDRPAFGVQMLVWPAIGLAAILIPLLDFDPRLGRPAHLEIGFTQTGPREATACALIAGRHFDGLRLDLQENGREMKKFPQAIILGRSGQALVTVNLYGPGVTQQQVVFNVRRRDTDLDVVTKKASQGSKKLSCMPSSSAVRTRTTNKAVTIYRQ